MWIPVWINILRVRIKSKEKYRELMAFINRPPITKEEAQTLKKLYNI